MMKMSKIDLLKHINFLAMISIHLYFVLAKRCLFTWIHRWLGKIPFHETLLSEKEDFYSHLNMEDIADADYMYAKWVDKDFEIKKLGE